MIAPEKARGQQAIFARYLQRKSYRKASLQRRQHRQCARLPVGASSSQNVDPPEKALQEAADNTIEDDEEWEDVMEEFEDFWMRDPKAPSEFEEGLDNAVKQDATSISNMEMETISFKALLDRLAKEGGQICILDLGLKDIVRNALENQGSGCSFVDASINQLTRDLAKAVGAWKLIVVVGVSEAQCRQAYTRLSKVFGLNNVKVLAEQ